MGDSGGLFSFFYRRRVPVFIWSLVLLGFGLVAFFSMPRESLPDLEIPTFHITTTWEGAGSLMVEKSVTAKLEKELRGMPGVKRIHSASSYGTSIVTVVFEADCPVADSGRRLHQRVMAARGELPPDAKTPRVEASSVNDLPVTMVALSGDASLSVLEDLAETVKRELERVQGVRKVEFVGRRKEVVRVQVIPGRLKSLGIPPTLVRERIVSHGHDAPWGRFENQDVDFTLRMDGAYDQLEDLKRLFIADTLGGGVVRLEDVAVVRHGHMRAMTRAALSWEGGPFVPVVGLSVLKSPGRDTMDLVAEVRRALARESADSSWPAGVSWRLTGDEAEMIEAELARGAGNGWQSMLAVFLVLLVLLTWREALVAAVSVPLTFMGSLAVLWAMGYTFNLLVMVGMIIALGLLVDDFILIMEGMHEGLFVKGLGFFQAVKRTISTYATPSFSGSVTTVLVFAPLAFIGGVDGKFIRVIPVTAAVCLVVSYLVSVVMGPPLLRLFVKTDQVHGPSMADRISAAMESRLSGWLNRCVVPNRGRAALWLAGALVLFMLSLAAAEGMRTTLYPDEDGRTIGLCVELSLDSTLDQTEEVARRLGGILRHKPYIEHVIRVSGGKDPYSMSSIHDHMGDRDTPHVLGFGCFLVPGSERGKLAVEYAPELKAEFERALSGMPGVRVYANAARGGPSGEDPVQIRISGRDMDLLRDMASDVRMALAEIPGVYDMRDNIGPARPQLLYRPMPEALDHHGLSQAELAAQMVVYMENEKVADFRRDGARDDMEVRLGAWWNSRQGDMAGPASHEEMARLALINSKGESVPLRSVAVPDVVSSTPTILRTDGLRSVTVLAKNGDIYVPEVLERMRPVLDEMNRGWPGGYDYVFVGEEETDQTYADMLTAFFAAMVLVYAVLALLFDSLAYPLIILSTVLFALVGVFFGFMLLGFPFSFSAAIGIVALVGIVVNDAIIVVETMRNHSKNGLDPRRAASHGASDRLRPIVSTTVTNFAGLLPLALSDPGWAPICQAIILGEITATVGALVLVPALYAIMTPEGSSEPAPVPR